MKFGSPADLGVHLYDRTVRPGMTGRERLMLALAAAAKAEEVWERHSSTPA